MHGGARGSGGPKGAHNDNYKHGLYTAEANVQPGIEHCVLTRGV
jgi:hypothetical protein